MIRFHYAAPSGVRYLVTVIEMTDGSFDAYAATKPENGREIPLAIEPSRFDQARFILYVSAASVARHTLTDEETVAPGEAVEQIGAVLAEAKIWTWAFAERDPLNPGRACRVMRTDYPQPLRAFLQ